MTRLRKERAKRGWTQLDVALRTGIHPATIAHLEAADIRAWPSYREKLSRLFGISPEELFERWDQKEDD